MRSASTVGLGPPSQLTARRRLATPPRYLPVNGVNARPTHRRKLEEAHPYRFGSFRKWLRTPNDGSNLANPPLPTPPAYVPLPFVLPPAALDAADRLITTLMSLVAVAPVALARGTLTFDEFAAHTLFLRLSRLITRLIRLSHFGVPTRKAPAPAPASAANRPVRASGDPTPRLPSRPGWLLAALPDLAPPSPPTCAPSSPTRPAPPSSTPLPTLHRTLRPLRSLGVEAPPPPEASPPDAPSPGAPPGTPAPSHPAPPSPPITATASPRHRRENHAANAPASPRPDRSGVATTAALPRRQKLPPEPPSDTHPPFASVTGPGWACPAAALARSQSCKRQPSPRRPKCPR